MTDFAEQDEIPTPKGRPRKPAGNGNGERAACLSELLRGDHVELAKRLVSTLGARGPVVFDDGELYQADPKSHVYAPVSLAAQSVIVQGFAGLAYGEKARPLRVKAADVTGTIRLAHDAANKNGFFAAGPAGVAFADTFVRVTAEKVEPLPLSPEHRARFAYPFNFLADATPTRLLRFFAEVFRGDSDASDKVRCIQEHVGASMLGVAPRFQRVVVCVGPGANGKGVLLSIMECAMPPGSWSAIPPQDFGEEYRLALLAGKRLNVVNELPEADILDSESFKAIVAGDAVTARPIRQPPFTFRPTAGHIFAANRLPGTDDHTHGFWRRFIVCEFNRTFEPHQQNPRLADEIISAELPAVVSWFLAGARRVLERGRFEVPPSSDEALRSWKRNADQVAAFAEEMTTPLTPEQRISEGTRADVLYRRYRGWASENGHRPVASNKFGARMRQLGCGSQKTETGWFYPVTAAGSEDGHD